MRRIAFCNRRLCSGFCAGFWDRIFRLSISTKSENALRQDWQAATSLVWNHFESDHSAGSILREIAVASDGFSGTLLTLFFLLYEYAWSFLLCSDHDRSVLVDDCFR